MLESTKHISSLLEEIFGTDDYVSIEESPEGTRYILVTAWDESKRGYQFYGEKEQLHSSLISNFLETPQEITVTLAIPRTPSRRSMSKALYHLDIDQLLDRQTTQPFQ